MTSIYEYTAPLLTGEQQSLAAYKGKVLLIVNTASECGFTHQYQGLEALYQQYKDRGFIVLGFPCNQFGKQEPGSGEEIRHFCELNYGVSFPLFEKVAVNGQAAHPLFKSLKKQARGLFGSKSIKWNFTKFLVAKDGAVIKRYAPKDKPESLQAAIEALL